MDTIHLKGLGPENYHHDDPFYYSDEVEYDPAGLDGNTDPTPPPTEQELSRSEFQKRIGELWQWLQGGSLTGSARADWAQQIRELAQALSQQPSRSISQKILQGLYSLESQAFGSPGTSSQPAVEDPYMLEGFGPMGSEARLSEAHSLRSQLENLREQIQSNENLSPEDRDGFLSTVDRYLSNLELNPSETQIEEIGSGLETLQDQFSEAANYPAKVNRLAKATGKDPQMIQQLMEQHGLDPTNLPKSPNAAVAALISDPQLSDSIAIQLDLHQKTMSNFRSEIDSHIAEANNINEANRGSDTSKVDSQSFTAHRWLYNAHFHRDERSQEIIGLREAIATEGARLLEALYGEKITVKSGADEAGQIQMGVRTYNLIPQGASATLSLGSHGAGWPAIELVAAFVDDEGDGKTGVVSWMREAHYPYHIYDTGGAVHSPSGNWNWDHNTLDIGRAV